MGRRSFWDSTFGVQRKASERVRAAAFAFASLALTNASALAQPALPPVTIDPQIRSMVDAVSAEDLRQLDTTLVGFGTRNLFSETLHSPTRGVYAARDWIRGQFEALAARSGGRLTDRHASRAITTISPPIMPMAMLGSGRIWRSLMTPTRLFPDRRSSQ